MKQITTAIAMFIGYIGMVVCGIWSVIEFIIYLVKDDPFNWWSLWMCLIMLLLTISAFIASIFIKFKRPRPAAKSKFQERLEKMQQDKTKYHHQ